jgi:predicted transcriptional regulator
MTKLLEQAIAQVRELPDDEQDAVAALLMSIAESDASGVTLDNASRAAIREGLAQAERGEFVADNIVADADKRHGI